MKKTLKPLTEMDIAALKDGIKSPFWKALQKCAELEIEELERKIFNGEHRKLSYEVLQDLIIERNAIALFLQYPEKYIEEGDPTPVKDDSEKKTSNDPYPNVEK